MTLLETIRADWLEARKHRDRIKATLIGTLLAAITTKEKTFNPARPITEAEVIVEIKKMLDAIIDTGRHLAIAEGRETQRMQNDIERNILEGYMPSQMNESEIESFAQAKKAEGLSFGAIMSALRSEFPSRYDGRLASSVVKRVTA